MDLMDQLAGPTIIKHDYNQACWVNFSNLSFDRWE